MLAAVTIGGDRRSSSSSSSKIITFCLFFSYELTIPLSIIIIKIISVQKHSYFYVYNCIYMMILMWIQLYYFLFWSGCWTLVEHLDIISSHVFIHVWCRSQWKPPTCKPRKPKNFVFLKQLLFITPSECNWFTKQTISQLLPPFIIIIFDTQKSLSNILPCITVYLWTKLLFGWSPISSPFFPSS